MSCFLNPSLSGKIDSTPVPPGRKKSSRRDHKDLTKNSDNFIPLFHPQATLALFERFYRRGPPGGIEAILFNYVFSTIIKEEES